MKRGIIGILAGFGVLLLFSFLEYGVIVLLAQNLEYSAFHAFMVVFQYPIPVMIYLIAGFVAGWIARQRGWLYGGLVGLIPWVLGLVIQTAVVSIKPLASYVFGSIALARSIPIMTMAIFISFLLTMFAAALGGYLGCLFAQKRTRSGK